MRRKLPSTQSLQCFEAAARHGSFTRAAQELALTPGAISRQVGMLEEQMGVALFRRTQHGMALTDAGADFARKVSRHLDALERDALDLRGRQGDGDTLQLGCVPTFAARWLIPRLPLLAQAAPGLMVHIESRSRAFLFSETALDAALYAGTPEQVRQWAGTMAVPLFAEEVVPVCSPALLPGAGAVSAQDIAALPLLQPSTRPDAWRQWFEAQGVQAEDPLAGPRYELFSMQLAAARCALGVALMPTLFIEEELAAGTLVVACARPLRGARHYYLVHPPDASRPALAAFKAWLLPLVAQDGRGAAGIGSAG